LQNAIYSFSITVAIFTDVVIFCCRFYRLPLLPLPIIPLPFLPRIAASHRQLRSASRQSVASVHSRATGRLSTHSQTTDPVIELMNKMFDKVAGDAAAQHADVAAQRADAAEQRAEMQTRMEREIEHREKEMADKIRLQLRIQQLEAAVEVQTSGKHTPAAARQQAAAQLELHTSLPATLDSVTQSTAAVYGVHSLSLPAPAPANTQHATLDSVNCAAANVDNILSVPINMTAAINCAQTLQPKLMPTGHAPLHRQLTENDLNANNVLTDDCTPTTS